MDKKNIIQLNELELKRIITESVKKILGRHYLNESFDGAHYFLYLDAEDEKLSTQEIIDRYDELKAKYLPIVIDNTEKWIKSTQYGINTSTCYACSIRYNNGGAMNIFAKRRAQLGSAANNGGHINWSNNSGGSNYWEVTITHFIPSWKLKKERRIVCQTKTQTFTTQTKAQVMGRINDFLERSKDIILEIL